MTASHAGHAIAAVTATPKMKGRDNPPPRRDPTQYTDSGSASLILAPMLLGRRVRSRSSRESKYAVALDAVDLIRGFDCADEGELRGSSSERGCQSGGKVLRPLTRLKLLKPVELAADRFVAARKARLQRLPRLFESDRAGGGEKPQGKLSANPCGADIRDRPTGFDHERLQILVDCPALELLRDGVDRKVRADVVRAD